MQNELKKVYLFTDGACTGNPGPGGWGAVLRYKTTEKELSGGESPTTNNRMELTAVIEGIKALKEPCHIILCTDSKYVADSLSKGWVLSWEKKGWMRRTKPVPNADLWKQLLEISACHKIETQWVKGHNGHPENERCDRLAVAAAAKFDTL